MVLPDAAGVTPVGAKGVTGWFRVFPETTGWVATSRGVSVANVVGGVVFGTLKL